MNVSDLLLRIDFQTERIPLYATTSNSALVETGKEAIVRTDLPHPTTLGVVSKDYRFISHKEVMSNFLEFTKPLGEAQVTKYSLPQDGGRFFAQIEYPEHPINVGHDRMNMMLIVGNSYDTTKAFTLRFGAYRLVCSNGLVIGEGLMNHRQTHMRSLDITGMQHAIMNAAEEKGKQFQSVAERMAMIRVQPLEAIAFLDKLEKDKKLTGYHVSRIKEHYSSPMFQAEKGTVWELYNAFTEYTSHASKLSHERQISISQLAWTELSKIAA